MESKATPQPRLDHIHSALRESTLRVEGKLAPHRSTTFSRANAVDTLNSTTNHQSDTVDALANLATATTADRLTVATLTDTIYQLSLELALAQEKLISSLLDNQRPLKRLLERGGSWNTSEGVADGKTSRGGATGPWDGTSIHYCHTHGHKCPHPSFKCPELATGHIKMQQKRYQRGSG